MHQPMGRTREKGVTMKSWMAILSVLALAVISAPVFAADKPGAAVPKYDPATEITVKGTVDEVRDRQCAVSGGMGAHVILKMNDGKTIEVHLAPRKFVKTYELVFNKGDEIVVTGSKVKFEDLDTIFAREVKRGNDT